MSSESCQSCVFNACAREGVRRNAAIAAGVRGGGGGCVFFVYFGAIRLRIHGAAWSMNAAL